MISRSCEGGGAGDSARVDPSRVNAPDTSAWKVATMAAVERETLGSATELEVLIFELQAQEFALLMRDVIEVVRAVALHALPNAPAIIEGMINVRGEVVPVLDVRARFQLARKPIDVDDHLILATAGQRKVALRVDRALGLSRVRPLFAQDATNLPRAIPHIAGVVVRADGLTLLHDLHAFLQEAESAQLDRALSASQQVANEGS